MVSNITVITLPSPVFDTGGRVACGKSLLMLPVARIVLGDGSMKRSAVRPSVRLCLSRRSTTAASRSLGAGSSCRRRVPAIDRSRQVSK